MKSSYVLSLVALILVFSFEINGQVPKSVCQITDNPVDEMTVITYGRATKLIDNDKFELSTKGCTILCDGYINEIPQFDRIVVVIGVVEAQDDGDDLKIDVEYWVYDYGHPPNWPIGTVFKIDDALNDMSGTKVQLVGAVTAYSDSSDGLGTFQDSTGSIHMDFRNNNYPNLNDSVEVLGIIEENSLGVNEIDVIHWYNLGSSPPAKPDSIAWTVAHANRMPFGTYCFVLGDLFWSNQTNGEGFFPGCCDTINIDFEPGVANPDTSKGGILVGGIIVDDAGTREIAGYFWYDYTALEINDLESNNEKIKIFPNPTSGEFFIESNDIESRFNIEIFNYSGKLIQKERGIDAKQPISIQSKQGIYFIKVYSNNEIIGVSKIIKTQ